jgi:quercetin dioxygenase-like cupin family protein
MTRRGHLAIAVLTAAATLAAAAVGQSGSPSVLRSRVFDSIHIKPEITKAGERRGVFDAPTATLERFESHVTTLNPGQSLHPPHKHVEEELMIVREGTVEATLNGQATRVEVGGMIFCASGEMHGLKNVGATRATYYVIKWFPHDLPKSGRSDGGTSGTK